MSPSKYLRTHTGGQDHEAARGGGPLLDEAYDRSGQREARRHAAQPEGGEQDAAITLALPLALTLPLALPLSLTLALALALTRAVTLTRALTLGEQDA